MSDAIGALSDTFRLYRRFPLMLLLAGVAHVILSIFGAVIPFGSLVMTPLLTGGLYGIILRAERNDEISLKAGINTAERYVGPLIAGYILQGFVFVAVTFLAFIPLLAVPESSLQGTTGDVLFSGLLLVFLAAFVVLQFFPILIVREGIGPAASLTQSVAFVQDNLVSVIVYSVLKFSVILGLYGGGLYVVSLAPTDGQSPLVTIGFLLFVLGVFLAPIVSASMQVMYYERRRGQGAPSASTKE